MMIEFAELTSPQVDALRADPKPTVLLLPVGAVEPHGPHAPLATDGLISAGMCRRTADALADDHRVRALVLPALPYGVTRYAAGFAGAVAISPVTLHSLVVEVCTALIDDGLPRIAIVNNHFEPEHVGTLRKAVDTIAVERGVRIGYLDLARRRNAARLTEEFRSGECHAGRYETSLVLADRPDLVDTEQMRALPRLKVDMPAAMRAGQYDFRAMGMDRAYCGAPAEATDTEGHTTFDTLTAMLIKLVRELAADHLSRPGGE